MSLLRSTLVPITFVAVAVGSICIMVSLSKNPDLCAPHRDVADEKAIFMHCMDLGSSPADSMESIRLCRSLANINARVVNNCKQPQN